MYLGNFWGMPAPMILLAYDGKEKELYETLNALNTDVNSLAFLDIRKEFLILKRTLLNGKYELKVDDDFFGNLSPVTAIQNGILQGGDTEVQSKFRHALGLKVIQVYLKLENRGLYLKFPQDLAGFVEEMAKTLNCNVSRLDREIRGYFKKHTEKLENSCLDEVVERFHLKLSAPDYCIVMSEQKELTPEAKQIWMYFHNKMSVIDEVLRICSTSSAGLETVFGEQFFDMLRRKPISLKYKVMEIFDTAKERQTAHLVPRCKKECEKELTTFVNYMSMYIDNARYQSTNVNIADSADYEGLLSALQLTLLDSAKLESAGFKYYLYSKDHLDLILTAFSLVCNLNVDEKLGVENAVEHAELAGIFGLNYSGVNLFCDSFDRVRFTHSLKIAKTDDELDALDSVIADIQALLDTLIPIGEAI